MFFKAKSCQLLDDPTGPAARRFSHYEAFLHRNHSALRQLAELEMLDRGSGLATPAAIQRRVNALIEDVSGLVDAITALAGGRYSGLAEALQRIAAENVGNCLVLAVDAEVGELQLLEFVNNARRFCERVKVEAPMNEWLRLEVRVAGKKISGALNGQTLLRFTGPREIAGYLGLWSKGDTTAWFANLEGDDAPLQKMAADREGSLKACRENEGGPRPYTLQTHRSSSR